MVGLSLRLFHFISYGADVGIPRARWRGYRWWGESPPPELPERGYRRQANDIIGRYRGTSNVDLPCCLSLLPYNIITYVLAV
jgi:hypothetical protein